MILYMAGKKKAGYRFYFSLFTVELDVPYFVCPGLRQPVYKIKNGKK